MSYLMMPVNVEQKGLPRNRELRCSWDDVLLSSTTAGLCSGIWATWNLPEQRFKWNGSRDIAAVNIKEMCQWAQSLYKYEKKGCTNDSWPHLPTDNTVTSPSLFSFSSLPSSFTRPAFGTVARVWWVLTSTPSSTPLFCRSVEASKEGRRRGCGGFRGSFRESNGGMSTGGHFLWAQRVQQ